MALNGILNSMKRNRASQTRDMEYMLEMVKDDVTDDCLHRADNSMALSDTSADYEEAASMVNQMNVNNSIEENEIDRILESTENMDLDDIIGVHNILTKSESKITKSDYISSLSNQKIDKSMVKKLEEKYNCKLSNEIAEIISSAKKAIFFDDGSRIISFSEMMDANDDLHIDFTSLGLLPIADLGENDFIVYHIKGGSYSTYNITDEQDSGKKSKLKDILK